LSFNLRARDAEQGTQRGARTADVPPTVPPLRDIAVRDGIRSDGAKSFMIASVKSVQLQFTCSTHEVRDVPRCCARQSPELPKSKRRSVPDVRYSPS
jgi:hypothetical protein